MSKQRIPFAACALLVALFAFTTPLRAQTDPCVGLSDGTPCDDGLICNGTDTCLGETCSEHAGNPCPAIDPTQPFCFEETPAFPCGECRDELDCTEDPRFCQTTVCGFLHTCDIVVDHAQCDNDQFCDGEEFCDTETQQCNDGTPVSCDPGEFCSDTFSTCVECETFADCVFCDGETCVDNICVQGTLVDCSDLDSACTRGECNETLNVCEAVDINENGPCSDENVCTNGDKCVAGECIPGVEDDCDDTNACTDDACNSVVGCIHTVIDCDDGFFCNGVEICDTQLGCAGATHTGNPCCTGATCNESTLTCDGCVEAPFAAAHGSRYIAITPAPGGTAVALRVIGGAGDPNVSCFDLFAQADGTLGATAEYRLPADWGVGGTIMVTHEDILPATIYTIQSDCGPTPLTSLSPCVDVETWAFGNVNNDFDSENEPLVDFADIQDIVKFFKGLPPAGSDLGDFDLWGDAAPLDCLPNGIVDFRDIERVVGVFKGDTFTCSAPCP